MLEAPIQAQILNFLAVLEMQGKVYFYRSQSGAVKIQRGTNSSGYMKTGKAGCPDITVCYKSHFVGIEVKSTTGKQSQTQKEAQTKIEKNGGIYILANSFQEFQKQFLQI